MPNPPATAPAGGAQPAPNPRAIPWLTTNELCAILRISRRTLERNRALFSCGVHYRLKNPNSTKNPHRLWRLDRVEETLMNPHFMRRKRGK